MFLAKVTGSVVATQKVASMTGHKLLTVEPVRVDPQQRDRLVGTGRTFVVVDAVGGGQGEMVLIVQGSSARLTPETEKAAGGRDHHRHRGHRQRRRTGRFFRRQGTDN